MLRRQSLVPGMFPGGDVVVAISQLLVKVLQQAIGDLRHRGQCQIPGANIQAVYEEIHGAVLHLRDEVPR